MLLVRSRVEMVEVALEATGTRWQVAEKALFSSDEAEKLWLLPQVAPVEDIGEDILTWVEV